MPGARPPAKSIEATLAADQELREAQIRSIFRVMVFTRLRAEREARGYKLAEVAQVIDSDAGNVSRIERGLQVPKHTQARALFEFYGGDIPIGAIFDPLYCRERGLDGWPVDVTEAPK